MTREITAKFPRSEHRMKEQMDDAMRSFKVNIVEGWKRPTTKEYLAFLGYSQASLAELTDNAEDCLRHGIISQADYDEYMGWLKKSDYLMNRLVASLEQKMERDRQVPYQERCRAALQAQKGGYRESQEDIDKRIWKNGEVRLGNRRKVSAEEVFLLELKVAEDFLKNIGELYGVEEFKKRYNELWEEKGK